jgi:FAD synthetase
MSGPSASEAPRKSRGDAAADAGTNAKSNARAKSNADIDAKTTILAAGCFDLLHYGHLRYLEEAKRLGGDGAFLVVVVARDSTIIKRKGRPPVMKEEDRRALVEGLKPVDRAILGGTDLDTAKVIRDVAPDIIALGYDQGDLGDLIRKTDPSVRIAHIGKYGDISSSKIKSIVNSTAAPAVSRRGP